MAYLAVVVDEQARLEEFAALLALEAQLVVLGASVDGVSRRVGGCRRATATARARGDPDRVTHSACGAKDLLCGVDRLVARWAPA